MKREERNIVNGKIHSFLLVMCVLHTALLTMVSCTGTREHGVDFYEMIDLRPPKLEAIRVNTPTNIELCLDEPVTIVEQSMQFSDALVLKNYAQSSCGVELNFVQKMEPGRRYTISMTVTDKNRNSLDITTYVYGYNERLPNIVINEFTTRGSGKHPDTVELYLKSGGNIGGLTLYEGSAQEWESRKVFPSVELPAGSYILVHFKPQGIAEEKDETTDPTSSGGFDAHDTAWDFWVAGGNGLGGNNGALTLFSSPKGDMLDAVFYTNRNSESDTKYRGFGTAQNLAWAEEIYEAKQWKIEEAQIRPEDFVFIDRSTATRSICRNSASVDSNGKEDWHIVPTSGYTFGQQNSDDVYTK